MSRTFYRPNLVPRELNQGGTSTSEVVFTSDGTNAVVLRFPQNLLGPNTSTGRQSLPFVLHYGGRVTGGTTTNFTPQLQWGTSTTPGSNTDVESGAAVAVNSNSGCWQGMVIGNFVVTGTATARIEGFSCQLVGGSTRTFTALAVSDNSVTTVDPTTSTAMGFVLTGTFSSGNAGNLAYLDWFVLEVIE